MKAYRLADNKTAELAEWDKQLWHWNLPSSSKCEFDLGLTGFATTN